MAPGLPSLLGLVKKTDKVEMAFKDVDDLERLFPITKEDHVTPEWKTADVGAYFRTGTSQGAGQSSETATLSLQPANEGASNCPASAFRGDVAQYVAEILHGGREVDQSPHSVTFSRQAVVFLVEFTGQSVVVMRPAHLDRVIDPGPQR